MDQYYIDEGYYDEGYFVYIAEAQSGLSSNFGVTAAVGVIRAAAAEITAEFTQTATISHIEGADLFAFAEANIAVTVSRIRDNNILALAAFDIATDARVTRTLDIEALSLFDLASQAERSRATTVETQAAFSLTADLTRVPRLQEGQAEFSAEFTQTTAASKTASALAAFDSQAELTATISHILGVDIVVNGFAELTVTADKIKGALSALTSEFEQTTVATVVFDSNITSSAEFAMSTAGDRIRITAVDLNTESTLAVTAIRVQSAQAELTATSTVASVVVKQTDIQSDLVAETTQTVLAVKTVNAVPQLDAIAIVLSAAFVNATGTVLLESTLSLSALAGVIKQGTNQIAIGLSRSGEERLILEDIPTFGISARKNDWTLSIWVRRDTAPSEPQPIIWTTAFEQRRTAGFIFAGNNIQTRFNFDPDETEAVWPNTAPSDQAWHHYLIRSVPIIDNSQFTSTAGAGRHWQLWIDGVYRGQTIDTGYQAQGQMGWDNGINGALLLGNGPVADLTAGFAINSRGLTGAFAQIWMGVVPAAQFDPTEFFDGYRDFGVDGTRNGVVPLVYNQLAAPYELTGQGIEEIQNTAAFYGNPLEYSLTRSQFALSALPQSTVVLTVPMSALLSLTAVIGLITDNPAELSAAFSSEVLGSKFIGVSADLEATAGLESQPQRIRGTTAVLSTQADLQATVGFLQNISADISAEATVTADVTVKPPIRITADLESNFVLGAAVRTLDDEDAQMLVEASLVCDVTVIPPIRIDALIAGEFQLSALVGVQKQNTLALDSTAELSVDGTVIPPIRIDADLSAEFVLTATVGSIEQFAALVASSGQMTTQARAEFSGLAALDSQAQMSTDAVVFLGLVNQVLQVSSFQVTVGDVINIDPYLQLKINPETRRLTVTKETRTLNIASESRTLIIEGYE